MIPLMSPKRNPKFKCVLFSLIPTLSFEGRDTHMVPENLYKTGTQIGMFRPIRMDHTNCLQVAIKTLQKTPFFSATYHLTWLTWIKHKKNPNDVYKQRERDRLGHFFLKKNLEKKLSPSKKEFKRIKKCPVIRTQGWVALLPC